ncbi:rhomboid family intramembrane serine protease, partial [Streptomyces sp. NPDC002738]
LFLPLRFPAWIVLIFWFVLQWMAARSSRIHRPPLKAGWARACRRSTGRYRSQDGTA